MRRKKDSFRVDFIVLFVAEGDHGIDLHSATGGDEPGECCYGSENEGDGCEGNRIVRGDAEQQVADQVRGGECAGYPNKQSRECKEQGFAQDHTKDRATRSTESNAYSDFVGSAGDGIGNHAKNSGSSENQGHGGKKTE